MSVYVDQPIFPFRGQMYCHMATDGNIDELYQMAEKIGLNILWIQNKNNHVHFDLSPSKRILAIKNGAIEVSCETLIKLCFSLP